MQAVFFLADSIFGDATGWLVDEAVAVLASVGHGPGVSDEGAGRQATDLDRAAQTALACRAGAAGMRHKFRLLEAHDGALLARGQAAQPVADADIVSAAESYIDLELGFLRLHHGSDALCRPRASAMRPTRRRSANSGRRPSPRS